jgi:hypothetical protein
MEISEDGFHKHLFGYYSITSDSLNLPSITLTETDFQKMAGHPPYPLHIVDLNSFEKDWPEISAAFHGYVTRMYVKEWKELMQHAVGCDRASLSSKLTKSYHSLMEEWELFGIELRENADLLPAEFIVFQNRLWTSRRLTWVADDIGRLVEGTDVFFAFVRERLRHFT